MIKKGCGCNKKQPETVNIDPVPEWEPVNPCPENTQVRIENHPDEEDLTEVLRGEELVLKFKDKVYNPMTYSGYGRVFLRKNMQPSQEECPGEMNVLTQSMFMDATGQLADHTIFIVQYDYDLNGKFITLPLNSILLFLGGSFKNGTLVLNHTLVLPQALPYDTFIKCTVTGPYMEGQMFYSEEGLRIWNGTEWVVLDGTGTIDLQSVVRELQTKVQNLISDVTNVQEVLDTKSNVGHTHAIANITGLQSALNEKLISGGVSINGITIFNGDNTIPTGGGGEGGSYTLPAATSQALGGIRIGYVPVSNTADYPVKLGTSGSNQHRAYVTVPGYNDSGLRLQVESVTNDLDNFKRTAQLKFDAINGLSAEITAIRESIGEDGGVSLEQLQTNLIAYVDTAAQEAVGSLTTGYWAFENDQLLRNAFSGFETIAGPNGSIASVFANYITQDWFSSAGVITQANLDGAMVALLAQNSYTTASIVSKVDDAVSSISLTADNINFNASNVVIERENDNALFKIKRGNTYSEIFPSGITLVENEITANEYKAVLNTQQLIFSHNSGAGANIAIKYDGLTISAPATVTGYAQPVILTETSLSIKHKPAIVGGPGSDYSMILSYDKVSFTKDASTMELGVGVNANGSFTADGKTITVQNGIITEITTN